MAFGIKGQYYKYREFSLNLLALYKGRSDVRAFLEIILSLSTLIIFMLFAIKPTALTMISLNKEINSKEETLNELNLKIEDLQKANSVYLENQSIVPNIDAAIFSAPQPDILSRQILGIAAKNSVTVLGVSVGQATLFGVGTLRKETTTDTKPLPNGSQPLTVSVNIRGDYPNLIAFLTDLENLRVPIKIDTVTLNSTRLESGTSLTELVNGRIPYLGK